MRSPIPALMLALAACAPPTGSGRGTGILAPRSSEAQELRAGQRAAREAVRTLGVVGDQELQEYVQGIGARLATQTDRPQIGWTFRVLDDPMPNAFAMPGGFVFVTRGMLAVINSEAELAGVLAHAIGHVNARHGAQALARQPGPQLGIWAVAAAELRSLDGGAGVGAGFLFFEYSADAERQADDLALRYMLGAGYDVRQMTAVFSALNRLEAVGGRSALPSWLATHPDPGGRAEATQRAASAQDPIDSLRSNEAEFLQEIEDLVYGHDPRQGYLRGTTFIQPDLRFRLDLPSGWGYRHLAQALVATSPGRDAALQLTLVEQMGPSEAAESFIRQSGVTATGNFASDTVNGNPVVSVSFRTTAGGGATAVGSWIAYGGRTYQLIGIAAGHTVNGHGEAFRQVTRSFAQISDARLLDVRPHRINIVRLGRATTFEDFARRYPSVVDAGEVALLNRVAGPRSRLSAGSRMKRIIRG